MNDLIWILIWAVVGIAAFIWLWRAGHLMKFSDYIKLTKVELVKCSWPSWEELKGSTVLVFASIILLGGFTVAVDQIFFQLVRLFRI
jgi:preprotein translocase SecE subunit